MTPSRNHHLLDTPSYALPTAFPTWHVLRDRAVPAGVRSPAIRAGFLFAVAVGLFSAPLIELSRLALTQEHYSHILLIPFVVLVLLYTEWPVIRRSLTWNPWLGAAVMVVALALYGGASVGSDASERLSLQILAFTVMCWGLVLFTLGTAGFSAGRFALLFLLFVVPLPAAWLDAIIRVLKISSAEMTAILFSWLGVPVFREGFVFSLSTFTIHVAEECSGIRSTLSLVITGTLAGYVLLRSGWTRLALVALVIPLAILKNACRIVGLALLANYVDPTYITNSVLHRTGGIPLFVLALGVLILMAWTLRRIERAWVPAASSS